MKAEVYKDAFKPTSRKTKLSNKSVIYIDMTLGEAISLMAELTKAMNEIAIKNQAKVAINNLATVDNSTNQARFSILVNKVL